MQLRRVFADGKTFVDCVPRRAVADILRDFDAVPREADAIAAFIRANFDAPGTVVVPEPSLGRSLRDHIRLVWPMLQRGPDLPAHGGSLLPLPTRYVVPGGRFRELYYWDSYFSMLGLVRDGYVALAEQMLDGFTDLIERFGHVPNGTRSYYLGRSQPPFYAAMVAMLPSADPAVMRRLDALIGEHRFWMAGADDLAPGEAAGRSVRMADGALLNRHWDARDTPRDESFGEDVETAGLAPHRHPGRVYRDLRAAAESGWDFSSRWLGTGGTMASIRTTAIVPVDLNAYLYRAEMLVARLAERLYDDEAARRFALHARRRRLAIATHLWSTAIGAFADHDLDEGRVGGQLTAATLAPLFAGAASRTQAASVAKRTAAELLAPGGLRTTLVDTGEQWDWPNGWAPLQWIAVAGLRRYGHRRLAREIARRWCAMVSADFSRSGYLHEKYDVEARSEGRGGEYVPQDGFGWTNGVTAAFLDMLRGG